MRLTTWCWRTHPFNKTQGIAIGPYFSRLLYISVPIGAFGFEIKIRKFK